MTTETEADPRVVTEERAHMLAAHAIYVQGGYSTPEIERARAEKDMADGGTPIDWAKMKAEVDAALLAKVAALPVTEPVAPVAEPEPAPAPRPMHTPTTGPMQRVDVTAVLANIDQGEAIRDRIKKLTAELKIHEDMVKDVLGEATAGVDGSGKVVVRYPFRNRSGLSKEKVKDVLSDEDYARCETVTEYRSLLYGEG